MDEKTLICSLIQDDLLNQKLINNLRDIGIDARDYQLHLSETIFKLMGIDRPVDDTTFDSYMLFSEIAKYFPVREQGEFRRYAEEIYEYLDTLRNQHLS